LRKTYFVNKENIIPQPEYLKYTEDTFGDNNDIWKWDWYQKYRGVYYLDNLRPICKKCNIDMYLEYDIYKCPRECSILKDEIRRFHIHNDSHDLTRKHRDNIGRIIKDKIDKNKYVITTNN